MVKSFYTRDDQRLPNTLKQIVKSVGDVQRPTGTERERTLLKVQAAVDLLALQQQTLDDQQAELLARISTTRTVNELSVTASPPSSSPGSANWESGSRTFSLPKPVGGGRYADISISGNLRGSSSGGSMPTAYLVALYDGDVVAADSWQVPANGFPGYPPGWGSRFRLGADLPIGATPSSLVLRLYVSAYYAGGSTTISISDVSATFRYGQRV